MMEFHFAEAMSTKQVAELIGVSERTIAQWKQRGRLVPIGVFGRNAGVYRKSDVELFKMQPEEQSNDDKDAVH